MTEPLPDLHQHLGHPGTAIALMVQHQILVAAREYLAELGFVELLPPVIGPVTDPGGRGSKQADTDFYGHRYKLMTSVILYKQTSLLAFDRIFYVAPNVRLEPPETRFTNRHLVEFHQIDVELAGASLRDAMDLAEGLVAHIVRSVAAGLRDQLTAYGRDTDAFATLRDCAFGRVTHAEAVADLVQLGHPQNPDAEIDWQGEEILSRKAALPFFVTGYPKGSRGFYEREDPEVPGLLRNFDLIVPEGYGEIMSGSEREFDYTRIVSRIRETAENPAKYAWYLDLVRKGIPGSAGFGLGIERLTRYLLGAESVWQVTAYPKVPGVVSA